ncbi:alkene reductase [Mycobacterium sp. CBMA271]|uniref:alkene reductase n=1 Tax=unclassified Mycobacteroides TaxID=2618759 RepID=UPI0012DCF2BD|nr:MULTISPECIES: alkene reductase [unclassified Mycobacteroides]MUM17892.1 alkene reductase [Mycobacteroides sp. CBMA 326]MUM20462.1 alkene reductase [Mycobacteroides sp. CBMA 271]
MSTAFDPITLTNGLELPNRIVMAPLTRRRAYGPGLSATPLMADYYEQRVSAGLIVSEALHPNRHGQAYTNEPGFHSQQQIESWQPVIDRVHNAGGRIYAQFMHGGRHSHPELPELREHGLHPLAPSPIAGPGQIRITIPEPALRVPLPQPREMTVADIGATINDFATAAENAMAIGFDGVELHGAYGYLIQQFLANSTNMRTDQYGGSIDGQVRFALELVNAVAERIGANNLALRISPGMSDMGIIESEIDKLYLTLVRGLPADLSYLHIFEWPGYRSVTENIRRIWPGLLVLNPHETSADWPAGPAAIKIVSDGLADMVSYGSMFISNPDLVHRLRVGAPLAPDDHSTHYHGDHRGYTDYATFEQA